MLEHTRRSGWAATLGNFASIAQDLRITDLNTEAITLVLNNSLHFGVSEGVVLWPMITRDRVQTLRELAHRGRPHTNAYKPEEGVPPPQEMGIPQLQRSTQDVGTGWRESGGMRYATAPPTNPYLECQTRQLYVTPLDDLVGLDEETINGEYAVWNTRVGVHKFLSCLARGRIQRTPMNGIDTVFDVCAHRLFRFFVAINNYNRENWYTSLRLSEMRAQDMYSGDIEMPAVCEIGGRTILYMLKSLDETSVGKRVKPYSAQLNLECGLMRDCIESYAREQLFAALNSRFGIDPAQFTRRERGAITHPSEGPLAMMLEHTRRSGWAATLGNFASIAQDLRITDLNTEAITLVLNNSLHFGVSEGVVLWPMITRDRVQTLRELAHRGRPHTNAYKPEEGVPPPQEMGIPQLQSVATCEIFSPLSGVSESNSNYIN
ncbi:hypothetical protein ACJJTC_011522 [Scirpophaga incertulas]